MQDQPASLLLMLIDSLYHFSFVKFDENSSIEKGIEKKKLLIIIKSGYVKNNASYLSKYNKSYLLERNNHLSSRLVNSVWQFSLLFTWMNNFFIKITVYLKM